MLNWKQSAHFAVIMICTLSCTGPQLSKLTNSPKNILANSFLSVSGNSTQNNEKMVAATLDDIIIENGNINYLGANFSDSIRLAVRSDPSILAATEDLKAKRSAINVTEAQKDFQISGSLYGGVEDVSDKTRGVALVLDANRMLSDGGRIDSQVKSQIFLADSAEQSLAVQLNERSRTLSSIWVDLNRYELLYEGINSRLLVLDPLIKQLEKVADAGLGDVTKVASAQRTVSQIRVVRTEISEKLEKSRIDFINSFGLLPKDIDFDAQLITNLLPKVISEEMVKNAPAIKEEYALYLAALYDIEAVEAKDAYNMGFESRVTRPFAGSGSESDEQIGLVVRKTFFNDKTMKAELAQAKASADRSIARLRVTHKEGVRTVRNAQQSISSLKKAIALANDTAEITSEEIQYLRKQLVIGGSTLESVLSAEARLYEAQAEKINFRAEQIKSELLILSTLGLLAPAVGL